MHHSDISLLCVICDRNKSNKIMRVLEKQETLFNLLGLGKGTASSKILNYLGLGETDKAVFFSILQTDTAHQVMETLNNTLLISKSGNGISFLSRMQQGCYYKPIEYMNKENGELKMETSTAHNLIIVVVNRGYSEEVYEAALASGATGGTIINARGCGMAGMEKFFGMTITPEKEMIMIVAENTISSNIMAGIARKTGPATDAGAVSFSMPLNRVNGIGTARL